MNFAPNALYHIYNRGNNNQPIFFNHNNYLFFLQKVRTHLLNDCHILAYCLMPNHFHLLVYTNDSLEQKSLNNNIAILLRSYTRAINLQEKRTGSLFQQKTKAKCLSEELLSETYPVTCLHYVHQNPLRANLVNKMEDWDYSSYKDYVGKRNGTLCNKELAYKIFNITSPEEFCINSNEMLDVVKAKALF